MRSLAMTSDRSPPTIHDTNQQGMLRRLALFGSAISRATVGGINPLTTQIQELRGPVEAVIEGRPTLLFGTNSYLGLNFHPDCQLASIEAIQRFGTGSTASRVASGNHAGHEALEAQIARFYGRTDATVFSTGFMANLGVISALARAGDAIFLDAHCHASIFDACKLSGATVRTFRHNDAGDLETAFDTSEIFAARTLVVVEGLYSVWGDLADLPPIVAVTCRRGGVLLVDEAHAMGVYGAKARGVAELQGVEKDIDIIIGTFSKSVGVIGGFCVTDRPELQSLRFLARSYLYTASLPPAIVSAASTAIRLIATEPGLRERLWHNARLFHAGLQKLGFVLCADPAPIGSVRLPGTAQGLAFWRALLERGVYVNLMVPPATPEGQVLLRFSLSAAHTVEQIEAGLAAFADTARSLSIS